jgi:hypothetical protein
MSSPSHRRGLANATRHLPAAASGGSGDLNTWSLTRWRSPPAAATNPSSPKSEIDFAHWIEKTPKDEYLYLIFEGIKIRVNLKLLKSKTFDSGVVGLYYENA